MLAFIIRRVAQALFVVLAMVVIVFFGTNVVGDPVWMMVPGDATQQQIDEVRRTFGFDQPVYIHFFRSWAMWRRVSSGVPMCMAARQSGLILDRMPATLELALVALIFAIIIGLPLGVFAGLKPDHPAARTIMAGSILGFSLPTFWVWG